MLTYKKLTPFFSTLLLTSPIAFADDYALSGGLTNLYSSVINNDISILPNPSGIDSGTLNIAVEPTTGAVSIAPGANIVISDFEATVNFLGTTRFTAVDTEAIMNIGAEGIMDGNRTVTMTSADADPAVDVIVNVQDCTGPLCSMIDAVNLELSYYTVTITFDETFSTFTGTLAGTSKSGSMVDMVLNGEVIGSI